MKRPRAPDSASQPCGARIQGYGRCSESGAAARRRRQVSKLHAVVTQRVRGVKDFGVWRGGSARRPSFDSSGLGVQPPAAHPALLPVGALWLG